MKTIIDGVEITLTAEQIKKIEDAKKPKLTAAKEWMKEFMKQKFTVDPNPGYTTYFLDNQWIFKLDFKNKVLWCHYYKVWRVLEKEFGMNYEQIQALQAEVVATTFNCKGFTPLFSADWRLH